LTTKHGELTTLWPHSALNKITSQSTYPDLPTTGAAHKRDKITLPKAVAKENNRGSIASVQKAGRASAKKRVAEEQARENGASENGAGENGAGGGESGDQVEGRAPKRARVARRSGRHV
jgi:nitric oxide reductase activation protein